VSGLIIGILSGLTGVGGGIFLVPAMVLGFGSSQRVAQGTSLVAILPTAAVGAITHHHNGNVDMRAAGWIAIAGVPAALVGSLLAFGLPDRVLPGVFGLFPVVCGNSDMAATKPAKRGCQSTTSTLGGDDKG